MNRLSLDEARSARDIARETLEGRVEQVRKDYSARGIGGRIVDSAVEQGKATASETLAIARESKGIIAGTAGLLVLWFFRRPLIDKATRLIDNIKDRIDD